MQRSETAVQAIVRVWVLIVILAPAENYIWLKNGKARKMDWKSWAALRVAP